MTRKDYADCEFVSDENSGCGMSRDGELQAKADADKEDLIGKILSLARIIEPTDICHTALSLVSTTQDEDGETDKRVTSFDALGSDRYPKYSEIFLYVSDANRTEEFCKRLSFATKQLSELAHGEFCRQYTAQLDCSKGIVAERDRLLENALDGTVFVDSTRTSGIKFLLTYREFCDKTLLDKLDKLLGKVAKVSDKILRFVKQNNLYGKFYQEVLYAGFAPIPIDDCAETLDKTDDELQRILDKTYIVDIFSDGKDELNEMLAAAWKGVAVATAARIYTGECIYETNDGAVVSVEQVDKQISRAMEDRYSSLNEELTTVLADMSEEDKAKLLDDLANTSGFAKAEFVQSLGKGEIALNNLIGLRAVKRMVQKIKAYAKRNKGGNDINLHMCFYGNPGTGKTEVARVLSQILYDVGALEYAKLVETDGLGLLGRYVGETAPKTQAKICEAMGGVLFVDEAYALGDSTLGKANYGEEAIAVLTKQMEDYRGKFCVILAGYRDKTEQMIETNPGLKSRIQFNVYFDDYTRAELRQIARMMSSKKGYVLQNDALNKVLDVVDYMRGSKDFANARTLRNVLEQVIMNQNLRTDGNEQDNVIVLQDVLDYMSDEGLDLTKPLGKHRIGFI